MKEESLTLIVREWDGCEQDCPSPATRGANVQVLLVGGDQSTWCFVDRWTPIPQAVASVVQRLMDMRKKGREVQQLKLKPVTIPAGALRPDQAVVVDFSNGTWRPA